MIRFAYALAAIVFLLDQLVKYWIIHVVKLEQAVTIPLLPFLSLTWVENRGVSMGMLTADTEVGRWMLVGLTAVIAIVVAFWIRRERAWPEALALGLVLGGAIGNIVDRVRFGYVVDFVHLHAGPWSFYVFNIADAAITIGVVILLVRALIGRSDGQSERSKDA
ncbi:signal peptidase II [Sandaracinobacter sp. RS1-74]|uniref:signal peptidase II n=1 Tax=Sandaracinobacteroides sayramensis TaxID=2913411 RepID=UPI001EDBCBD9|nr:signal peptidase II [Sandaracinobacteroides sayramensis]MCG2839986.1 signal peptidase II [Sandaracinobacteroides sayramensis]